MKYSREVQNPFKQLTFFCDCDCTSLIVPLMFEEKVSRKKSKITFHIKVFLSLNLYFLVHPLANLALRGFDPAVADKC